MKFSLISSILLLFLLAGCKTSQIVEAPAPVATITETRNLDTLVVTAPKPDNLKKPEEFHLPVYHPSYTRKNDLLHTKLDLKFDWEKQYVLGNATLSFKPSFYPTDQLELDAKNFEIHSVTLSGKALEYDYDGQIMTINLGNTFTRDQQYTINIDYTAKPAEGDRSGSSAITSDQGLFFINHDGADPTKPMQIWTQGETENNSRWFPTIDKPNERCTQEIYLTVQDKFKTLSNGLLVSSTKNDNGTRTDYWKMDLPHAPYLFMIAVGDYAVVKDTWQGITVDYYVEPEYENSARGIFSNTLEMLDFFSTKLGIKYPWPKYSQIVVRDYVSGAMENTTGVIFGEFVQKTLRELIDNHNERIVAHELFHHWFGDLVTCESWANLTMNEGFANYSEYLWFEHKYGKDEADYHLFNEMQGYLNSSKQGIHPLIYFGYSDKEQMFDAHSYNKGGLVLHMLRNYVGDEAFWASLNLYLTDNEFTAVEAHDLRLAFEAITGEDLNWFFNQWYFNAGHPELVISNSFDESTSSVELNIEQIQNTDRMPAIFEIPMFIDIYLSKDEKMRKRIRLTERNQKFTFKVPSKPALINIDADKMLVAEKQENKTEEEYIFQYYHAPHFLDRFEALQGLANSNSTAAKKVFADALNDPFWFFRSEAISLVDVESNPEVLDKIETLAKKDERSDVRAMAIEFLASTGDKKYIDLAKYAIDNDKAYPVVTAGLQALIDLDFDEAKNYAKKLESENFSGIINAVGAIYAESGDLNTLNFFENSWKHVEGYDALSFIGNYLYLAKTGTGSYLDAALVKLETLATTMTESPWRRFAATKSISDLSREYQEQVLNSSETNEKTKAQLRVNYLNQLLKNIVNTEQNDYLKGIYQQFLQ